jgi:hypothetical protein
MGKECRWPYSILKSGLQSTLLIKGVMYVGMFGHSGSGVLTAADFYILDRQIYAPLKQLHHIVKRMLKYLPVNS